MTGLFVSIFENENRLRAALVLLSLSLTVCALAYADVTNDVAPSWLLLLGILPAIGFALLLRIIRLIAVGRLAAAQELNFEGRHRSIFLWAMTLHLAVLGAVCWAVILLLGGVVFEDIATPLKALISLVLLFVFTTGLKNCLLELLIMRGAGGASVSSI